ncbi:PVC-type heme-binding CxxCH protein [Rubinisphaera margarita]|uniref:PVC-type heme-binding CxxCH protein n=1 Tax=Rubinisphaera margarita TaxID=2909586 RepID=UPI001EE8E91C|nr:PVC-type heme-binding CxxCH protein [Rubinisphaera margarita]MCG6157732.1 c-type cytochrome [Rubinisphaera margarita]
MTKRVLIFSLFLSLLANCPLAAEDTPPLPMVPATSPDEAANTLQLQDGFRAELIAAEPLVCDPVDIAYDENGLAYVCEMTDYPYVSPDDDRPWEEQQSEPIGRVRVLEDTDGDGRYDRSDILADGLSWPAGIACWKGGVYVAATPDLLYLKDTDGDRKADVRRVVFEGFRKYNVQAVMNNLEWGLDHRIYAAGSSNGGLISGKETDAVSLGRNDFRFTPVDETFEVIAGGARFGNTRDNWGHRFLCNIRNPVQHVLFPLRYQRRNRSLLLSSSLHDVAASGDAIAVYRVSPPEPWRVISAERQANSFEKTKYDSTQATGYVTSSSGVTVYRGAAYPPEYSRNAFVGEVAGNLAIRYVLQPSGVTYEGHRPYEHADFLASTDNWFRPVNFANAPDGTLHVLDMYRQTIEHPWSLPDDLQERLDLTEGRDRGRIYRLIPPKYAEGFTAPPQPRLSEATIEELVNELSNPNGWWRDTAHRLIYERQDPVAIPLLRTVLKTSPNSLARLHAFWSLSGLNALESDDVLILLGDEDHRLTTQAVLQAEPYLKSDPKIRETVLQLASAAEKPLRFQVALSLGESPGEDVTQTLIGMLRKDGDDPWMRAAILSSLGGEEQRLLTDLLADAPFALSPIGQQLVPDLAYTVSQNTEPKDLLAIINRLDSPDFAGDDGTKLRDALLISSGRGLKRQRLTLNELAELTEHPGSSVVTEYIETTLAAIADETDEPEVRASLIPRLESFDSTTVYSALEPLISSREPAILQASAITTLSTFPEDRVADLLLARYPSLSPLQQQLVVERLLTRTSWLKKLFDAIEANKVAASYVPAVRQDIYRRSSNQEIREQAARLFQPQSDTERGKIVEHYLSSLPDQVDIERGREVYRKHCSNCHRSEKEGYEVGPHLSTVRNRSGSELVVSILDPNREISPNYLSYVVVTDDGLLHTGVIVSESATSLTLRGADKKEIILPRDRIEELQNTGQSLMPVSLEKALSPQAMADLIAFLKSR